MSRPSRLALLVLSLSFAASAVAGPDEDARARNAVRVLSDIQQIPESAIPDTLDWDLWLGGAAQRPFTAGDQEYQDFVSARNERSGRGGSGGQQPFGFYLPFNWRGFYEFGTGLIGDWGVHILGPANWVLALGSPTSVECIH